MKRNDMKNLTLTLNLDMEDHKKGIVKHAQECGM